MSLDNPFYIQANDSLGYFGFSYPLGCSENHSVNYTQNNSLFGYGFGNAGLSYDIGNYFNPFSFTNDSLYDSNYDYNSYFSYPQGGTGKYINFYGYRFEDVSDLDKKEETTTTTPKTETSKNGKQNISKKTNVKVSKETTQEFVNESKKYYGYNEDDGSYLKISKSPEWCCDFVSYIIKEVYEKKGIPVPDGIINHRVVDLKKLGNKKMECLFGPQINKIKEHLFQII